MLDHFGLGFFDKIFIAQFRLGALYGLFELIFQLANLSEFTAAPDAQKPENAAATIVDQMQIYLHEAIDPQAEMQRLRKQKDQLEKAIKGF